MASHRYPRTPCPASARLPPWAARRRTTRSSPRRATVPALAGVRRQSLAGGEWPLWNPDLFAGYPFLGNAQTISCITRLPGCYWLLPLAAAFAVSAPLHLWLAGVGMYAFARVLGSQSRRQPAGGAGLRRQRPDLTGLEVSRWPTSAVWLPWVAAAAEVAWRRRSWAWTAGAGLLFGVLAVAGHLPWFVYSGLFLALWLGGRVLALALATARGAAGAGRRALAGQAARAVAILLWGPALAAVHLLPFGEMLGLSSRAGKPFACRAASIGICGR